MFDLLRYGFIQNAFLAGSCIAVVAALSGYFLILRGLTFAGHALPNIGFAGAAGAVLLGIDPIFGLFAFTVGAGVGIALLGKEARERDIAIGVLMTCALGLGLMFLSLYSGYAERVYSILFGTILGISSTDVWLAVLLSLLVVISIVCLFRPLLFSSIDPEVAQARGVPVRGFGIFFLILVAITVSISVQLVGALLIFTLLVGPAATATRLARRPLWAVLIALGLSLGYMWLGLWLAIENGVWPPSFYIAMLSFGVYLPVRLLSPRWTRRRLRQESKQANRGGATGAAEGTEARAGLEQPTQPAR